MAHSAGGTSCPGAVRTAVGSDIPERRHEVIARVPERNRVIDSSPSRVPAPVRRGRHGAGVSLRRPRGLAPRPCARHPEARARDPTRGIEAELRGRGLLSHESQGFCDLGFSGSLAWEGKPGSDRGAKLRLTQTVGGSASDGADALLSHTTLEGLAANDDGEGGNDELKSRRLELTAGYGIAMFGGRFTGTPEIGLGLSDTSRDYRLGWRLGRRRVVRARARGDAAREREGRRGRARGGLAPRRALVGGDGAARGVDDEAVPVLPAVFTREGDGAPATWRLSRMQDAPRGSAQAHRKRPLFNGLFCLRVAPLRNCAAPGRERPESRDGDDVAPGEGVGDAEYTALTAHSGE